MPPSPASKSFRSNAGTDRAGRDPDRNSVSFGKYSRRKCFQMNIHLAQAKIWRYSYFDEEVGQQIAN
jgi:hypothetical protein